MSNAPPQEETQREGAGASNADEKLIADMLAILCAGQCFAMLKTPVTHSHQNAASLYCN